MSFHPYIYARAAKRLLAGGALLFIAIKGCSRSKDPLEEMYIAEPAQYFRQEGFVEMVPPLRLPLRTMRNRVEVWLKIPDRGVMSFRQGESGPLLGLPPDSVAARIESLSANGESEPMQFFAADVRGTRFGANDEHFFVLKPTSDSLPAALRGWSWLRGSAAEQALADDKLAALVGANLGGAEREERLSALRTTNACANCHVHTRKSNAFPEQFGHVNRGTDDSGCFQVQSILSDELPLESYFPLEQNLDDRFISFWCGGQPAPVADRQVRCADGSIPRGRLAVREGRLAADEHVLNVCRSRRYLYAHLSDAARNAFEQPLAECGIGSPQEKTSAR